MDYPVESEPRIRRQAKVIESAPEVKKTSQALAGIIVEKRNAPSLKPT
jgi:hypothetical protein